MSKRHTRKGDLIMLTRQTASHGVIIPANVPLLLIHQNSAHVVVRYDGKDYKLRRIEDRMKIVTSEMAKVLFHEND